MLRTTLILTILQLTYQFSFSQAIKIKQQIKEISFELSISSTKYDVRKTLHSSGNFTELTEYPDQKNDRIDAEFKNNYKLSYLTTSIRRVASFWFNKGTDINFAYGIEIHYPTRYAEICSQQFKEIVNFFKPISYTSTLDPYKMDSVKVGEIFYAYSSLKSYQANDPYLIIRNQHSIVGKEITSPPPGEYYELAFTFYNGSIY